MADVSKSYTQQIVLFRPLSCKPKGASNPSVTVFLFLVCAVMSCLALSSLTYIKSVCDGFLVLGSCYHVLSCKVKGTSNPSVTVFLFLVHAIISCLVILRVHQIRRWRFSCFCFLLLWHVKPRVHQIRRWRFWCFALTHLFVVNSLFVFL